MQASCLPRSENRSLLCPVRLGQSTQLPAMATRCASRLSNGAIFEDEQDVLLNPELQIADGEKNALGLLSACAPILLEASGECLFLLVGWQLRQQQRMADADLLAVEGFDHDGQQARSASTERPHRPAICPSSPQSARCCTSARPSRESAEALRLFHRMNVAALEVFDQLRFQRFGIGNVA